MYKSIVDQMKCYERSKLINWTNKAKVLAVRQMDSNILVCVRNENDTGEYFHWRQSLKFINFYKHLKFLFNYTSILS